MRGLVQFWVALNDVDEANGCMQFVPGRHGRPLLPHVVASGAPAATLLRVITPILCPPLESRPGPLVPSRDLTWHPGAAGYRTIAGRLRKYF